MQKLVSHNYDRVHSTYMYGKKATMSSEEVLDIMQRHSTPEDTIVSYGYIDYGILYDVLKVWV